MPDRPWHLAVWMQESESCTHKELFSVVSFVCMDYKVFDTSFKLAGENNSDLPISCILRNPHVDMGTFLCHWNSVALKQCQWLAECALPC